MKYLNTLLNKVKESKYDIFFYGDLEFAESYQARYDVQFKRNVLRQKGYDYTLEKVKHFLNEADLNIANFESVITNEQSSSLTGVKACVHWDDPEIVPELLKRHNMHAVSLGNNHGYDYDRAGLIQTLQSLDAAGVSHFGAGLDEKAAAEPYVKNVTLGKQNLNLYVFGGYKYRQDYDKDFHYYAQGSKGGVNLLIPERVNEKIAKIKKEDKDAYIVMFPHFGFDLQKTVQHQREMAHAFIDAGADIVIGHGPHMINEIEYYKGIPIIYSLGNFMFAADFHKKSLDYSLIAKLSFKKNFGLKPVVALYPIYTNEIKNNYQTRPIAKEELPKVIKLLCENNGNIEKSLTIDENDKLGICIYLTNPLNSIKTGLKGKLKKFFSRN